MKKETPKKKTAKNVPLGRPPAITEAVRDKLKLAWTMGCTDKEAAAYAEIAEATIYNHQNADPEFLEWKDRLKQTPFLKARKALFQSLDDPQNAKWFLERKLKEEFSPRLESTGANGKDLPSSAVLNIPSNATPEQIEASARGLGAVTDGYNLEA